MHLLPLIMFLVVVACWIVWSIRFWVVPLGMSIWFITRFAQNPMMRLCVLADREIARKGLRRTRQLHQIMEHLGPMIATLDQLEVAVGLLDYEGKGMLAISYQRHHRTLHPKEHYRLTQLARYVTPAEEANQFTLRIWLSYELYLRNADWASPGSIIDMLNGFDEACCRTPAMQIAVFGLVDHLINLVPEASVAVSLAAQLERSSIRTQFLLGYLVEKPEQSLSGKLMVLEALAKRSGSMHPIALHHGLWQLVEELKQHQTIPALTTVIPLVHEQVPGFRLIEDELIRIASRRCINIVQLAEVARAFETPTGRHRMMIDYLTQHPIGNLAEAMVLLSLVLTPKWYGKDVIDPVLYQVKQQTALGADEETLELLYPFRNRPTLEQQREARLNRSCEPCYDD